MSKKKDTRPIEEQLLDALNKQSMNTEQMTASIHELVKWIKVTSHSQVGTILREQVHSAAQKIVYANSDGEKSTKEFFELSGMYPADVSENWKKWARAGIVEQVPAQGGTRGKSLFPLEDFGIEVPKKSEKASAKKSKQETEEG